MEQISHLILKSIIVLYPILLGCGTVFFYKRNSPGMMKRFYFRMVQFDSARKFYAILFFIMLLIYNYCCFDTYQDRTGVLMAAIFAAPFLVHRIIDRVLRLLSEYADLTLTMLVLLMEVGLVTGYHVIVVTGLTYLVASLFYPSSYFDENMRIDDDASSMDEFYSIIIGHYYGRPTLYVANYLKHLAQNNHLQKENNDEKE